MIIAFGQSCREFDFAGKAHRQGYIGKQMWRQKFDHAQGIQAQVSMTGHIQHTTTTFGQ
jgi:hypothetical protein